ncbi:biogenesis of lysosome-related organelles complex 1 subunit 6 [Porites harrisoni]
MSNETAVDDADSTYRKQGKCRYYRNSYRRFHAVICSEYGEPSRTSGRINVSKQNQGILIETMQQENDKFVDCISARNLALMLSYVRTYHIKLMKIKQDMSSVEDRVGRLQKRAMKLKLQKEKEERNKAEAHEKQLELERQLTAKVAGSEH